MVGDTVRFIEISVLLYFTFLWWSLCSFFKAVLVVNTHSTQCTSTAVTKTQRALGWRVVLHAWRRVRWRYYCGVNTQLTITQLSPQTCTLQWLWMHYSGLANRITWFVAAYCASSFPAIQPPSESSSGSSREWGWGKWRRNFSASKSQHGHAVNWQRARLHEPNGFWIYSNDIISVRKIRVAIRKNLNSSQKQKTINDYFHKWRKCNLMC